ncbi:MAG: hypothetical protein GFH27_549379n51 [Chloroflexi bacterium AL-W]|nr:hypothetical protein [Chloroflexi bacterium AL-N1]NOK71175.1 hypothetical protein [Chloroflexi bacterium AL-N10]NOK78641.1 hypothetical protein [Chloroflexi bacterium AL-N5]NOK85937.1 hypothetical protein [Chloroflexi bacterium AL-W]NOK92912.1 hypothetical protein [Chloroflexi bacterium AL-N15]
MSTSDLPLLLDEIHSYIRMAIAAGFEEPDTIIENAMDVFADNLDPVTLRLYANRMTHDILTQQLNEQANWEHVTDCDRLDHVFAVLEQMGIICRQDFTCCTTCGSAEIVDEMAQAKLAGVAVCGYAFYHSQDTERAVDGDGLYLSYGADEDSEDAITHIGEEIINHLHQHGLTTDWNGSAERRILVHINWQRRQSI